MKKIQLLLILLYAMTMTEISNAQVQQDWVRKIVGSGTDNAAAIAVGNSGNVLILGNNNWGNFGPSTADMYTARYNSSGFQSAFVMFNSPSNSEDEAKDIATDPAGNVYVVGTASIENGSSDIIIIKYNSSLAQQWVTIFNTPQNYAEGAKALAVDATGNVYVTGTIVKETFQADYLTVKLNTSGVVQWSATFNGSASGIDEANDIAVDALGNVYVTGFSAGQIGNLAVIKTGFDYLTIKYNSNGVQQWAKRFNAHNRNDIARSLALDASGNVYVTGSVSVNTVEDDCMTIKYSTDGVAQWSQRIRGPFGEFNSGNSIVVDGSGNAFITGTFTDLIEEDVLTVKYNTAGVQQWRAIHNSGGNRPDKGIALALDQSGNVYVAAVAGTTPGFTNSDFITLKYNPSGVQLWVRTYNGPENQNEVPTGIAVVNSSSPAVSNPSVYVYGMSANDVILVKYSQPTQRLTGPSASPATVTEEISSTKIKVDHYPNPVNSYTNIQYELPGGSRVRLEVYDELGRKINTLVDGSRNAGRHIIRFSAENLSAGLYHYKLIVESGGKEFRQTKTMIIQR